MLTIIVEDSQLRHGLFPGPGTIQEDGMASNKHPKSEFEWTIAQRLFGDNEIYTEMFALSTKTPKGRSQWATKIKNKLTQ